jgi:C1A family cysteine protease
MITRKTQKYGWIPSLPDPRDFTYKITEPVALPSSADLRAKFPPVYNQLQTSSCTGNAWGAAFAFALIVSGKAYWAPSRLFIYYGERSFNGTTRSDSGAMLRDGAKTLNKLGTCNEIIWPFDEDKVTVQPSNEAYTEGLKNIVTEYQTLSTPTGVTLYSLKHCLASGIPFVFGFTVFDSFESDEVERTGIMPMPDIKNESVLGGHAVVAVGYDDEKKVFIIRNSWGEGWGDGGYFYMPYDYILNPQLASDFWCINSI